MTYASPTAATQLASSTSSANLAGAAGGGGKKSNVRSLSVTNLSAIGKGSIGRSGGTVGFMSSIPADEVARSASLSPGGGSESARLRRTKSSLWTASLTLDSEHMGAIKLLYAAMRGDDEGIVLRDRKLRLRKYRSVASGIEIVDWIAAHSSAQHSRSMLRVIGQLLMKEDVIVSPTTKRATFADDKDVFYNFNEIWPSDLSYRREHLSLAIATLIELGTSAAAAAEGSPLATARAAASPSWSSLTEDSCGSTSQDDDNTMDDDTDTADFSVGGGSGSGVSSKKSRSKKSKKKQRSRGSRSSSVADETESGSSGWSLMPSSSSSAVTAAAMGNAHTLFGTAQQQSGDGGDAGSAESGGTLSSSQQQQKSLSHLMNCTQRDIAVAHEAAGDNLVFDRTPADSGMPQVRAATLDRLVEQMTTPGYLNMDLRSQFLLSYGTFTTFDRVVAMLKKRFYVEPPTGLDGAQLQQFEKTHLKPVQLRVLSTAKDFIDLCFHEFVGAADGERNVTLFLDFLDNTLSTGLPKLSARVRATFARKLRAAYARDARTLSADVERLLGKQEETAADNGGDGDTDGEGASTSSSAKCAEADIADLGALDEQEVATVEKRTNELIVDLIEGRLLPKPLARQLSLVDQHFYVSVRLNEFLGQAWTQADKETRAPTILAFIRNFNRTSTWVTTLVVSTVKMAHRVVLIEKLIDVAAHMAAINNFAGLMAFLGGLNSSAVRRLKGTWEKVQPQKVAILDMLGQQMNFEGNFKQYRAVLGSAALPCVPYLGIFLTDLVFLEDGNPSHVPSPNYPSLRLVNFDKCRRVADIVGQVAHFQMCRYPCDMDVPNDIRWLVHTKYTVGEAEGYHRSLQVEPRNSIEHIENLLVEAERLRSQLRKSTQQIAALEAEKQQLAEQASTLASEKATLIGVIRQRLPDLDMASVLLAPRPAPRPSSSYASQSLTTDQIEDDVEPESDYNYEED
jgi:RasGEF domain/RasGEF N-terminal motif/Domain found in Dishevelled, Egl-10, and Pleckstrin (DEP)